MSAVFISGYPPVPEPGAPGEGVRIWDDEGILIEATGPSGNRTTIRRPKGKVYAEGVDWVEHHIDTIFNRWEIPRTRPPNPSTMEVPKKLKKTPVAITGAILGGLIGGLTKPIGPILSPLIGAALGAGITYGATTYEGKEEEKPESLCPVCKTPLPLTPPGEDVKCPTCGFVSTWTRDIPLAIH